MTFLTPVQVSPDVLGEIVNIGLKRRPNEACGVILPTPYRGRQVFEMPNRSKTPANEFKMTSEDILLTLEEWATNNPEAIWENITIWHTHPSGKDGPSKTDLNNRIVHCGNLVVALHDEGHGTATWF